MTTITLMAGYARYLLTSLPTLAFGMSMQSAALSSRKEDVPTGQSHFRRLRLFLQSHPSW